MAFFKNDWIPFVCSTDISIAISSDKLAIRTKGDGQWKKYTYQDSTFTVTLSGLLKFDAENWTGWDMIDNQLNFSHILVRCTFDDENGNVRTLQGYVMIEASTLSIAPGALVKNDFALQGNGKLDIFDGLVACPTVITGITVDGQTASDGIVHVSYTYTGSAYQIKYRIDDMGDYAYAVADLVLDIPGLALGSHSIEIIPVCQNGYEGTGDVQDFVVTQDQTCGTVITSITVNTTNKFAQAVYTGTATQMKYRIDGGQWNVVAIATIISLLSLPVGNHTIDMVPICSNNVEGTGNSASFTIASNPSQSLITYNFSNGTTGRTIVSMSIWLNGVLTIQESTTTTGTFVAPVGATIKAELIAIDRNVGETIIGSLAVQDDTLGTVLSNQTRTDIGMTLTYTFTANGDDFTITEGAN